MVLNPEVGLVLKTELTVADWKMNWQSQTVVIVTAKTMSQNHALELSVTVSN